MDYIIIHNKQYRVADLVVMLYLVGVDGINDSCSNTDIIEKINRLSDKQEIAFNGFLSDYGQKLI